MVSMNTSYMRIKHDLGGGDQQNECSGFKVSQIINLRQYSGADPEKLKFECNS